MPSLTTDATKPPQSQSGSGSSTQQQRQQQAIPLQDLGPSVSGMSDLNLNSNNNASNNGGSSLDMSRINRLRDSERRKKVEQDRTEKLKAQMASYEGMNKLAQLAGELGQRSQQQPPLNGIENPSFIPEGMEDLQTLPPLDSLEDAADAIELVSKLLPEDDIAEELSVLKTLLNRDEFSQSLSLYNTTVTNWTSPLGVVTSPHDDKENTNKAMAGQPGGAPPGMLNRHASFKQYVEPLTSATDRLVNEVRNNLSIVYQSEAQQLLSLLYSPHLQVLFPTHDEVALMREGDVNENQIIDISKREDMIASSYGNGIESSRIRGVNGDSDLQIVRISKTVDALGATIKNEGDAILISRIITGGLIDKTGQLGEGDEIIKVNGTPVRGRHVDDVSNLIACASGDIELVIRPTKSPAPQMDKESQALHVRALFEYDPFDDLYVPCRELALKFDKGDILHITDRSDQNWWQAFRDGETGITLAGLIPSSKFEKTRQNLLRELDKNKDDEDAETGFCKKKRKNKKNSTAGTSAAAKGKNSKNSSREANAEQTFQTYEEMALYQQPEEKKRPIILIGANNCGRQEIRQRLLDEEKHRFQAAVPHTTRNILEGEVNGRDYYFVTKDVFLNDIADFKFIEHGVYEKHYYGTSIDSIRHIINAGKICVLNLHAPSLPALMKTELMPYIIFISAPNIETLREIFSKAKRTITENELKDTVEQSIQIEKDYACYFDKVLRLTDVDRTYDELLKCINKLDTQPQWVPQIWLRTGGNY